MRARSGSGSDAPPSRGVDPTVDYELDDRLGLRLIGPSPADVEGVARQLGPLRAGRLRREPDLCVRFVPELPTPGLRYLDEGRSGFTDDGFFVFSRGRRPARARIPFDALDRSCEIVCEHGIGSVPLLLDFLKLAALRNDLIPLHASAFEYRGAGVLLLGWPHGGKTSGLLAFAEEGASLIADDLVFLDSSGSRMFGLPAPIEVADWQLGQLARARACVSPARRALFGGLGSLDRLRDRILVGGREDSLPARLLAAVIPPLRRRLRVRLPADAVFPGAWTRASEPHTVFWMVAHAGPGIHVEPADPEEMLQRAVALAQQDWTSLQRTYLAYQVAFPGRRNPFIERAYAAEAGLLRRALAGKRTHLVTHPRPVSLRSLHRAMRVVMEPRSGDDASSRLAPAGREAVPAWSAP